jgi:mannosyltransferase
MQSLAASRRAPLFSSQQPRILLALILVGGTVLRLIALGTESLWFDEAYSVWVARHGVVWQLVQSTQRIFPPAYYVLLHFWLRLGSSEFAVRLLSVVLGVMSILAIHALATYLFGARVGVISAFLLAISPLHIAYSQEARMYILLALLGLGSAFFMLRALNEGRRWHWLAYVLCTALAMSTHYFALFLVPFQNLYALYVLWRRRVRPCLPKEPGAFEWRNWLLSQVAVASLSIIGLAGVFSSETTYWWGLLDTWHGAPTLRDLVGMLFSFSLGTTVQNRLLYLGGLLIFGLCAAWSLVDLKPRRPVLNKSPSTPVDDGLLFVGLYLLAPLGLVFVLSQLQSFWVLRYVFPFLPPWCIILARGLDRMPGKLLRPLMMTAIVLASIWPIANLYRYQQKEDWRGAVNYISSLEGPGDVIVLVDEDIWLPFEHYYRGPTPHVGISRSVTDRDLLAARIGTLLATDTRIWLVLSHTDNLLSKEYLKTSRYTQLVSEKVFTQIEVDLFAIDSP